MWAFNVTKQDTKKGVTELTESGNGLKKRVQDALELIRPALQADGGDVELVEVTDGGPMATITLQMGIERTLKENVPEVTAVESVSPWEAEEQGI